MYDDRVSLELLFSMDNPAFFIDLPSLRNLHTPPGISLTIMVTFSLEDYIDVEFFQGVIHHRSIDFT